MQYFQSFLFLSIATALLAGCGAGSKDKTPAGTDITVPSCGPSFIQEYNEIGASFRSVKADLVAVKPKDPAAAADARRKTYRDARACRAKAVEFQTKYSGAKCTGLQDGKTKTIDVDVVMAAVVKVMDKVRTP